MPMTPPKLPTADASAEDVRELERPWYVVSRGTAIGGTVVLLAAIALAACAIADVVSPDLAIGVFAVFLGVFALFVGIHTDWGAERIRSDTRNTLAEMRHSVEMLDEVRMSLTTRGIGTFPDYVREISDGVRTAESSVDVLCDFPAYAAVTRHDMWRDYHLALCQCRKRSTVPESDFRLTLVCLSESARGKLIDSQFPDDEWEYKNQDREFADRVAAFMRHHTSSREDGHVRHETFIAATKALNVRVEHELDALAVTGILPLYCWVFDENRAIFAVASLRDSTAPKDTAVESNEVAFRTDDPVLIDGLVKIVRRYSRAAREGTA
jgi:hypothetical protein